VGKDIGLLLAGREEAARRALFIKAEVEAEEGRDVCADVGKGSP